MRSATRPTACPIFSDPAYQARYEKKNRAIREGPYIARAQQALPVAKDLPGFRIGREEDRPQSAFVATRLSDQAKLKIYVYATPNNLALEVLTHGIMETNVLGPLPKGTPSGKPFGQVAWKSHRFGGDGRSTKLVDYELLVLDRPSLIKMRMFAHIGQDEQGHAKWKPITKADQLFMEHIARVMLKRLKRLKLTHDTFKPS